MLKDGCLSGNFWDSIGVEYGNVEWKKVVDLVYCFNGVGEVMFNIDEI